MKRTILTVTVVFAAFVLGYMLGSPRVQTFNSSTAIAAPTPVPVAVLPPTRCPNIREAIGKLQIAQEELRHAAHDFCGKKQAAMEAVHNARNLLMEAEKCRQCTEETMEHPHH